VKRIHLIVLWVLTLSVGEAMAADLAVKAPPPVVAAPASDWDLAFGGALMTDYIFRGITQSAHRPSVAAYSELRYNLKPSWQLYFGSSIESIDFPNHPAAEVDFYGGVRPTFGPMAFDIGVWYYYYPGGTTFPGTLPPFAPPGTPNASCTNGFIGFNGACNAYKGDVSFWEFFGKDTYTLNDNVAITGDVFFDPSWLNSGAPGTYASGILKLTAPGTWLPSGIGAYLSGELGYYWFGTTDSFYGVAAFPGGIKLPDYLTWNVGLAFTWKVFTLDLRYYDTNLSRSNCDVLTGDQTAGLSLSNVSAINPSGLGSNWCGATFVAKISADLTVDTNLK
jgi:hypothetical protein